MVLLARRSPHRAAYPSRWSFPGGHVEHHETLTDALIRELREEVGSISDSVSLSSRGGPKQQFELAAVPRFEPVTRPVESRSKAAIQVHRMATDEKVARVWITGADQHGKRPEPPNRLSLHGKSGAGEGIRTADPNFDKVLRRHRKAGRLRLIRSGAVSRGRWRRYRLGFVRLIDDQRVAARRASCRRPWTPGARRW